MAHFHFFFIAQRLRLHCMSPEEEAAVPCLSQLRFTDSSEQSSGALSPGKSPPGLAAVASTEPTQGGSTWEEDTPLNLPAAGRCWCGGSCRDSSDARSATAEGSPAWAQSRGSSPGSSSLHLFQERKPIVIKPWEKRTGKRWCTASSGSLVN